MIVGIYFLIAIFPFIARVTDEDSGVCESIAYGLLFPKLIYRGFQKAWKDI